MAHLHHQKQSTLHLWLKKNPSKQTLPVSHPTCTHRQLQPNQSFDLSSKLHRSISQNPLQNKIKSKQSNFIHKNQQTYQQNAQPQQIQQVFQLQKEPAKKFRIFCAGKPTIIKQMLSPKEDHSQQLLAPEHQQEIQEAFISQHLIQSQQPKQLIESEQLEHIQQSSGSSASQKLQQLYQEQTLRHAFQFSPSSKQHKHTQQSQQYRQVSQPSLQCIQEMQVQTSSGQCLRAQGLHGVLKDGQPQLELIEGQMYFQMGSLKVSTRSIMRMDIDSLRLYYESNI